jgi:hypothetical protein
MYRFSLPAQKVLCLLLIIVMVFPAFPRITRAQLAVTDPANTAQGILQTIQGSAQSFLQNSLVYKEFVMDLLLNLVAKQLIRSMTQSIVNWINSGFSGSPAFLTDPGAFFLDAADQVTGAMLDQNGPLASLCTPFSFDIRLSLALQVSSRAHQRYTCTLGAIIQNTRDAAARGVTINGFMAGDFSQGGWPAFIALSTEPQNNYSSASLYAYSDLLSRIAKKEAAINIDLNRGRGFMSWTKCEDVTGSVGGGSTLTTPQQDAQLNQAGNQTVQTGKAEDREDTSIKKTTDKNTGLVKYERCKTETPGSLIENTLANQLGSGVRQLELADEINEIAGALVNQLVTAILTTGLNAVSGGSSGGPSTVSKILGEGNQSVAQVQKLGKQLANDLKPYLTRDQDVIDNYQKAVVAAQGAQEKFVAVRACWIQKGVPSQAAQIDAAIATKVTPLLSGVVTKLQEASTTMDTLLEVQRIALTATTTAQLEPASEVFSDLLRQQALQSVSDLQEAKDALKDTRRDANKLEDEAAVLMRTCQAYLSTSTP